MTTQVRAAALDIQACVTCGLVVRRPAVGSEASECPRCAASLRQRRSGSVQDSLAWLLAGVILYIPANVLPVLYVSGVGGGAESTIVGGVVSFWRAGSWGVAALIFTASVAVPATKFVALALLLWTTHRGSRWARSQRTALYRFVEIIGYWSMLDVVVVALTAVLLRFKVLGTAEPRLGIVFFCAVVITTMLAVRNFDPRLIWDAGVADGTDGLPDSPGDLPAPRVLRRRWTPSLIWLVPLSALVVGVALVVNAWRAEGPRIIISFQTAEGLEVGKTLVKYRDVTIGHVTAIALSRQYNQVLVSAELLRSANTLLTTDARFWVVRPRVGIGWASGLETLISGPYIAMEAGESQARQTAFTGLENPPPSSHGLLGKSLVLHAQDAGSLTDDAPVYFRHIVVGHVIDRELEGNGDGVRVTVFIDAPYDRWVTRATRFWNAGGIDLTVGADGVKLRTQSVASVLAGGIAFETAPTAQDVGSVTSGAQFTLFNDEPTAMAPPDGEPRYVRMRFVQSLRGLSVGAPVDFVGVNIGQVFSLDLDYDAQHNTFPVIVTALIYPRRLGKAYATLEQNGTATSEDKMARLVGQLVAQGLRAQPRSGNLLSGQLYIALDFIPGARPVRFDADARPLEIPAVSGSVQQLQQKLVSIVDKLDRIPIVQIGEHADTDLVELDSDLQEVRTGVLPAGIGAFHSLQGTLGTVDHTFADDAPWRDSVDQTLVEARSALRSLRSLTDYLDRHPEALLRGRHASAAPVATPSTLAADESK